MVAPIPNDQTSILKPNAPDNGGKWMENLCNTSLPILKAVESLGMTPKSVLLPGYDMDVPIIQKATELAFMDKGNASEKELKFECLGEQEHNGKKYLVFKAPEGLSVKDIKWDLKEKKFEFEPKEIVDNPIGTTKIKGEEYWQYKTPDELPLKKTVYDPATKTLVMHLARKSFVDDSEARLKFGEKNKDGTVVMAGTVTTNKDNKLEVKTSGLTASIGPINRPVVGFSFDKNQDGSYSLTATTKGALSTGPESPVVKTKEQFDALSNNARLYTTVLGKLWEEIKETRLVQN